jgi:dipeptidase E
LETLDEQHVYQGEGRLKLLLTSAGITNDTIREALENMLGKPMAHAKAVCIPTAIYAMLGGNGFAWQALRELVEIGWAELGILELTALPSLLEDHWLPALEAADVIWVGGGNTGYLSYWMQESGLARKIPQLLRKTVYVGVSAGSMIMTYSLNINHEELAKTGIYYDDEYDEAAPPNAGSDKTLQLVDFTLRPHLNSDYFHAATLENMEQWAAKADVSLYAIDDQTAIKVIDDMVEVISEGEWKLFEK